MSKNDPFVSIVIPTANRSQQLTRLLISIKKSSYKDYEIIVVNDAEKSLSGILKIQKITVLENGTNKGLAYSRTRGAEKAKGKYVLFIDDDNVIDKFMIEKLIEGLEAHKGFMVIGPLTYFLSNKKKIAFLGATIHLGTSKTTFATSFEKDQLLDGKLFVTNNLHNCFMVRKELGDKVGWFDEEVFMSGTEFDMFQRIKKIYPRTKLATDTTAICYHDVLELSKNNTENFVANYIKRPKRIYYYQRNKGLLAARYGTLSDKLLLSLVFYPLFFGVYAGIFLRGFQMQLFIENLLGVISGYGYLMR